MNNCDASMNQRHSIQRPEPSKRARTSLSLNRRLREQLDALAVQEHRTLNAQCEVLLERAVREVTSKPNT